MPGFYITKVWGEKMEKGEQVLQSKARGDYYCRVLWPEPLKEA